MTYVLTSVHVTAGQRCLTLLPSTRVLFFPYIETERQRECVYKRDHSTRVFFSIVATRLRTGCTHDKAACYPSELFLMAVQLNSSKLQEDGERQHSVQHLQSLML